MSVLNPVELEVLIHTYYIPENHSRYDTPAITRAYARLVGLELISKYGEGSYICAPRGSAHVRQLINIPLPEQGWVDRNGEIIT